MHASTVPWSSQAEGASPSSVHMRNPMMSASASSSLWCHSASAFSSKPHMVVSPTSPVLQAQTSVIQTAGKVNHHLLHDNPESQDDHRGKVETGTSQVGGMESEVLRNGENDTASPKLDSLTSMAPLQSSSDNQEDTTSTSHQVGSNILNVVHAGQGEASPVAQETLTEAEGK